MRALLRSSWWTVLVALGGCGSPSVHFYSLPTPPPVDGTGQVTVVVGPIRIPPHLNRTNIAWQTSPVRIQYDEDNRWSAGFEAEILQAMTEHLSAKLTAGRVVSWPAEVVGEGAVQIVVEIQRLDITADGPAFLRARYLARRGVDATLLGESVVTLRAEMSGDDAEDAVEAYAELIEALAADVAAAVGPKLVAAE